MDSIYFRYQISPVNMVYSIKVSSPYHFLVQVNTFFKMCKALCNHWRSVRRARYAQLSPPEDDMKMNGFCCELVIIVLKMSDAQIPVKELSQE